MPKDCSKPRARRSEASSGSWIGSPVYTYGMPTTLEAGCGSPLFSRKRQTKGVLPLYGRTLDRLALAGRSPEGQRPMP